MPSTRRFGGLAVALALAVVLTACSSAPDQVHQQVTQAVAAAQSTVLSSRLLREGKGTVPATSVSFEDAMKELTSTHQSLAQLEVQGRDAVLQHRALVAVRKAMDALLTAQRELDRGSVSPTAIDGLRDAVSALRKVPAR